ncbi:MAG: hypothetical protein R3C14_48795 [Caldilineaceae bacterium]
MNKQRFLTFFLVIAFLGSNLEGPGFSRTVFAADDRHVATQISNTATIPLADIVQIAAGELHTCALTKAGGVKCWGSNEAGQLGNGSTQSHTMPKDVMGLSRDVTALSSGGYHTCALTTGGGVKCWGWNAYGQLGNGSTEPVLLPLDVIGLKRKVKAVAAGLRHTCILTADGGVECWGDNNAGQLGNGTISDSSIPLDVVGLQSGAIAISTGSEHTCSLLGSGLVKCWGRNSEGQLGNGNTVNSNLAVDVVAIDEEVRAISAGAYYTCALTLLHGVKCWGDNNDGQLGNGSNDNSSVPLDVNDLNHEVSAISAGNSSMCVLTTANGVKCWGRNLLGVLGIGNTDARTLPVDVIGLNSGIGSISVGGKHSCSVTLTSSVKCWGSNSEGQLGNGVAANQRAPVAVFDLNDASSAIGVGDSHSCVLMSSGAVTCWGANRYGQLGNGTFIFRQRPVEVTGLDNDVIALSVGSYFTCALTTAGGVKCWGFNGSGQLGNGSKVNRSTPGNVINLRSGVRAISAGRDHVCALTTSGGVQCWGLNHAGQLGNGNHNAYGIPVQVSGLDNDVRAIAAGEGHTCALMMAGNVKCWGQNNGGQLGNSSTISTSIPINVSGLSSRVSAIGVGRYHTCVLTTAGGVQCWGWNGNGQLGNGSTKPSSHAMYVSGLESDVSAISVGDFQNCALTTMGAIKCWGWNGYGQLGNGSKTDSSTPVDVIGLDSGVSAISTKGHHTCALLTTGGAQCWGENSLGQLGDGRAWATAPVDVIVLEFDHLVYLPMVAR